MHEKELLLIAAVPFCKLEFVGVLAFVNSDRAVPRCDRVAQSCCHRVSVSDGLLSPRRESNQSAA
jgi:hypothetical protein